MDTIVQVEGLHKTYGATVAVDEVSKLTGRLHEIEAMLADLEHYKDGRKGVATNREYRALKKSVESLIGEWDELTAEAERMKMSFRSR